MLLNGVHVSIAGDVYKHMFYAAKNLSAAKSATEGSERGEIGLSTVICALEIDFAVVCAPRTTENDESRSHGGGRRRQAPTQRCVCPTPSGGRSSCTPRLTLPLGVANLAWPPLSGALSGRYDRFVDILSVLPDDAVRRALEEPVDLTLRVSFRVRFFFEPLRRNKKEKPHTPPAAAT